MAARQVSSEFAAILPVIYSLPRDAVIAADQEPLVWLYTRHATVPFYVSRPRRNAVLEPPADLHRAYLERQGVTHLLVTTAGGGSARELERLWAEYPDWLTAVRRWPTGAALFEIVRER